MVYDSALLRKHSQAHPQYASCEGLVLRCALAHPLKQGEFCTHTSLQEGSVDVHVSFLHFS